ncbi:MAG TPA: anhydro-N-acetylmuramic acid kinase [Acidimicrobiia bacterium]|nr:anhydro-N-acetylmuramic acid kinase [Acidimicrobiia bacterium]HKN90514.1 anhydro-N-acetylmuramic acid kinase [Acidimicrobiia bacterium]HMC80803.1 anhydro-N-acetylmuramic acid kinase [Acidimicrobiia bacterium]
MIVIGLMSGTSMDGIDAAAADLELDGGVLRLSPLGHDTTPYPDELARALRAALPPNPTSMETVCRLDTVIGQEFAAAAERAAGRHPGAALVVAHGQTVFHWVEDDGRVAGTLQIGRPAWIAERTGLPVVSDLRSADVAAGGQGAPLVALFDVLLLGGAGADPAAGVGAPRAALNLGGIANVTVVPPARGEPRAENPQDLWAIRSGSSPAVAAAPLAYDAGPANALLDAAVVALTRGVETCDRGGQRAARGRVDEGLLAVLLDDPFLAQPPPKTTGKERYHHGFTEAALARLGRDVAGDDLLATLTAHAAEVAAAECRRHGVAEVVASGGGTDNPVLMKALAERLAPARLRTIDELGIPSAAKEAYAFAVLGFLTWHGLPGNVPSCTGARHPAVLGSITPGRAPLVLPPPAPGVPSRLEIVRP